MKAASIADVKKELSTLPPPAVLELLIRMVKYKKENKELLSYLLFEADDLQNYINMLKDETEQQFREISKYNIYNVKKSLRKILRTLNKHIKYTGSRKAEAELLIYFIYLLKSSGLPVQKNTALRFMYHNQIKKAGKAIETLHEDLKYDFERELEKLAL